MSQTLLSPQPTHAFGYIPDLPDQRDHRVGGQMMLAAPATLPASASVRAVFGPAYDQLTLGSCTGNGIAGALEYDRHLQKLPPWTPSRLFIYYNERVMEHTVRSDSGAQIRDGIKAVSKLGAPPESSWPYDLSKWKTKPTKAAFAEASKHPAIEYAAVEQTLRELQSTLAAGYPIIFGFSVYESFESDEVARTGIAPMPGLSEKLLGGHCCVFTGYDNATRRFEARNNWGPQWGDAGYFSLPFEYVLNPDLTADFWVVRHTA